MKIFIYLVIIILSIYSCKKQDETLKKTSPLTSKKTIKVYSNEQIRVLVDSLKYDYDGDGSNDFESDIAIKIKQIGKPSVPYLLQKLDDTTRTQKHFLFSFETYAVGDVAKLYLWHIIGSEDWLNPSEEEIIKKISPKTFEYYEKDSAFDQYDQYDYFIRNSHLKMSEQQRRQKYKEEFIKALNKDLIKTD